MINTIETGIGIGFFPIMGIGICIGFKQTLLIGIGIGIGNFCSNLLVLVLVLEILCFFLLD